MVGRFTAQPIKHFLLTYSNRAITRLLEAASANATENMTMVSDDDYEIVYASGAVMLKAVGSFMLIFLSFFLR